MDFRIEFITPRIAVGVELLADTFDICRHKLLVSTAAHFAEIHCENGEQIEIFIISRRLIRRVADFKSLRKYIEDRADFSS